MAVVTVELFGIEEKKPELLASLVNAKPAVGLTVVSLPTRRRRSGRGELRMTVK